MSPLFQLPRFRDDADVVRYLTHLQQYDLPLEIVAIIIATVGHYLDTDHGAFMTAFRDPDGPALRCRQCESRLPLEPTLPKGSDDV